MSMKSQTLFQKDPTLLPLAERMRPKDFDDLVGQEHITAPGKPLRVAVEQDALQSIILWGPSGSGKTTLAHIIAERTKAAFVHFSAASSGVPELKKILQEAEDQLRLYKKRTILFVDEIHHFNKSQQHTFLPVVENGTVILIGATTENPSFEIISPLLSRSLLLVLHPLTDEALDHVLTRVLENETKGLGALHLEFDGAARSLLIGFANGDARILLNGLEFIGTYITNNSDAPRVIDGDLMRELLSERALRYDKTGEDHYNTISAFIKSMRDSDPDGALYWLARMVDAGENPRFVARRMIIFASEDISNADPHALLVAVAVAQAVEHVGMPEAAINLAHGAAYLATAPKSNASYKGLLAATCDVKNYGALPVPLHLRNAVTDLMKELGYGKNYKYAHNFKNAETNQEHLPEELKGKKYYQPS